MKRVLVGIAVVLLVLACAAGAPFYTAFGHNLPIVDGQKLGEGVETVKDGIVSVIVLDVAPGKVALVDCGNDKDAKAVFGALSRRGLDASAVTAIFLTHGHPDHTAGCRQFPGAEIYALKPELATIGDAAKVTRPLDDGSVSKVGDIDVEAFATPGHTPGSAVYLARGVLFFGDSASGSKDGTMHAAVGFTSKDPDQNVASLKVLAARLAPRAGEVKTLAFAHSGPLEGFAPFAAFSRTH